MPAVARAAREKARARAATREKARAERVKAEAKAREVASRRVVRNLSVAAVRALVASKRHKCSSKRVWSDHIEDEVKKIEMNTVVVMYLVLEISR